MRFAEEAGDLGERPRRIPVPGLQLDDESQIWLGLREDLLQRDERPLLTTTIHLLGAEGIVERLGMPEIVVAPAAFDAPAEVAFEDMDQIRTRPGRLDRGTQLRRAVQGAVVDEAEA